MLFRLFFSSKIENLHHFMHKNTPKTSSNIGSEMFITRPSLITKNTIKESVKTHTLQAKQGSNQKQTKKIVKNTE
jgi:hypothetical protein